MVCIIRLDPQQESIRDIISTDNLTDALLVLIFVGKCGHKWPSTSTNVLFEIICQCFLSKLCACFYLTTSDSITKGP